MKTILKNKWHLHALVGAILAVLLQLLITTSDSLRDLEVSFIALFVLFCASFVWEWGQNVFYKANQTMETSWGDIIASVIGGTIGIAIYYIF
jgi:hypothetical protein